MLAPQAAVLVGRGIIAQLLLYCMTLKRGLSIFVEALYIEGRNGQAATTLCDIRFLCENMIYISSIYSVFNFYLADHYVCNQQC